MHMEAMPPEAMGGMDAPITNVQAMPPRLWRHGPMHMEDAT